MVCVSLAVQPPPGQSLIQPFGLAVAIWANSMLTMEGAISVNCVLPPGNAVVGDCGAGLSAGVLPSACTYTRKRASCDEIVSRMFLRHSNPPFVASTKV